MTESYEVKRIPVWARIVDVPTNRARELIEGMEHTLTRLKSMAEARDEAGRPDVRRRLRSDLSFPMRVQGATR